MEASFVMNYILVRDRVVKLTTMIVETIEFPCDISGTCVVLGPSSSTFGREAHTNL